MSENSRSLTRLLLANGFCLLLVFGSGCQSLHRTPSVFSRLAISTDEEAEFVQPHRMAVIWKESVVNSTPGKPATRGFGGRVYFYDAGNEPVRVDGELVVYAFDDSESGRRNRTRIPDRKYVFRADKFQEHFSQTDIGASYSVWIPWDQVGGQLTTVSLLPVFRPLDGTVIQSGQSIAILPGKSRDDTNKVDVQTASVGVRKASAELDDANYSHAERIDSRAEAARRRRTTTIDVPRSMGNHLRNLNQVRPATSPTAPAATSQVGNAETSVAHEAAAGVPADPVADNLYERLKAENEQTFKTGFRKRPVVFGSPGPVR